MNRKQFITKTAMGITASIAFPEIILGQMESNLKKVKPLAITMWDFSWLERRWPGAGYEDWDLALDELKERGYNAVRIDAYPHLVSADAEKEWTLLPHWHVQNWGSQSVNKVQIQPNLNKFIAKCKERDIKVGLSTWYRKDEDDVRMKINSAKIMAEQWVKTVQSIEKEGLLDAILFVDLCNEWPGDAWAPFFTNDPPEQTWGAWHTDVSMQWMNTSIGLVRKEFPKIPLCYSFDANKPKKLLEKDLKFVDFLEPHIWMVQENKAEFYNKVGYKYDLYESTSYDNLAANGEKIFREKPEYWKKLLTDKIATVAKHAAQIDQPLITTECWGVVDYKDWPLLKWDWVKELSALGTKTAAASGQWLAIATSNFCGPQFVGMWRDVEWHQRLTTIIKESQINDNVKDSLLYKRMLEL
ncbi:MAG: hypothetical protein KAG37_11355 [Flavobacteriales bacterium]|nr:hypothetical protein [Flavobacteriales bacterium]